MAKESTAHNYAAARQLLADLQKLPPFGQYVFRELFDNVSKSNSIETAAAATKCQIAVTPGSFSLVGNAERGGALLEVTVMVYVFTSSQYASGPAENETVDALAISLAGACNRFVYRAPGVMTPIPAHLKDIAELDMVQEAVFSEKVAARAIVLGFRLNISKI